MTKPKEQPRSSSRHRYRSGTDSDQSDTFINCNDLPKKNKHQKDSKSKHDQRESINSDQSDTFINCNDLSKKNKEQRSKSKHDQRDSKSKSKSQSQSKSHSKSHSKSQDRHQSRSSRKSSLRSSSSNSRCSEVGKTHLRIKWGFPVMMLTWNTIWRIVIVTYVLNGIALISAILLMIFAVRTQVNVGDYLNMVSDGDGTAIPVVLSLSGLFCLPLNIGFIYTVWQSCRKCRNKLYNTIHFSLIVGDIIKVLLLVSFAVFCVVHAYSAMQHRLHSGILDAMMLYKNNSAIKKRMDILQINFQCCGSKSYNEWFDIPWYDTSTATVEQRQVTRDDAPFSCCSQHTHYPCIHHDLMSVGSSYLYAPETNLSVSEHGCLPVMLKHTRAVAWFAFTALFTLALLEATLGILHRILQTAHTEMYRYDRNCHWHTAWLFGFYKGNKVRVKKAPKPPPIPVELTR